MSEITKEEMENKHREIYIQAFTDGIQRCCEFYEIALRELSVQVSKKLRATVETLFTQKLATEDSSTDFK